MPSYIGFSTLNANKPRTSNAVPGSRGGYGSVNNSIVYGKKFRTLDQQLVVTDLLNAFNIKQGQKVGQPSYGTTLWDYVFEPNSADVQFSIENEVRRVISLDPRIQLNTVKSYPQENGILIEIECAVTPFNQASLLSIFFNTNTATAQVQKS